MKGSAVVIDHVSKRFGGFCALDDVSITIKSGEFFSLLGPSGCGKTTLLRILAGFEFPDDGTVLFDGEDVLPLPPEKRRSNTVFQSYALFPHMTVYENIAFPLRLKKVPEKQIREKVIKYLRLVQLEGQERKMPDQISGGQRQRVAIARALIGEPSVLLLDEPLSALDAKLRSNLLVDLDTIHDKIGITFIYVTHDQNEALSVSDRIAVMNKGKVLQIGTPFEIYECPATQFVARFIGETNSFVATVETCNKLPDVPDRPEEYACRLRIGNFKDPLLVTDYEMTAAGQKVCYTVRPEKIYISHEMPPFREGLNVFPGVVEEVVYSGFQSKFYVRLRNNQLVRVYKQHKVFLDDGPEIEWQDKVFVSWTDNDGYIVEDILK
ncbi:MAG: ABC transporter ATP-binding protein [Spirochaetia bacterium]|jgi:spermidine/putrescine transport system ATP-binding protein|nr:ABC transporter ATP-binding protein [Spirochaetia bacterium]